MNHIHHSVHAVYQLHSYTTRTQTVREMHIPGYILGGEIVIGLCMVLRTRQTVFTGQKTQPTVSK